MTRATLLLSIAALLAACAPSSPVSILTHDYPCYTDFLDGHLVVDADSGVAVESDRGRFPVVWPKGAMGRMSGSQVEVLDSRGSVMARTDTDVRLGGAKVQEGWYACAAWPQ